MMILVRICFRYEFCCKTKFFFYFFFYCPLEGSVPCFPQSPLEGSVPCFPQSPLEVSVPCFPQSPLEGSVPCFPQSPLEGSVPCFPQSPLEVSVPCFPQSPLEGSELRRSMVLLKFSRCRRWSRDSPESRRNSSRKIKKRANESTWPSTWARSGRVPGQVSVWESERVIEHHDGAMKHILHDINKQTDQILTLHSHWLSWFFVKGLGGFVYQGLYPRFFTTDLLFKVNK